MGHAWVLRDGAGRRRAEEDGPVPGNVQVIRVVDDVAVAAELRAGSGAARREAVG